MAPASAIACLLAGLSSARLPSSRAALSCTSSSSLCSSATRAAMSMLQACAARGSVRCVWREGVKWRAAAPKLQAMLTVWCAPVGYAPHQHPDGGVSATRPWPGTRARRTAARACAYVPRRLRPRCRCAFCGPCAPPAAAPALTGHPGGGLRGSQARSQRRPATLAAGSRDCGCATPAPCTLMRSEVAGGAPVSWGPAGCAVDARHAPDRLHAVQLGAQRVWPALQSRSRGVHDA